MIEKKPLGKEEKNKNEFGIILEEMTNAGLHFGHRTSRVHPKMKPYICAVKNTVHIIDLEKTLEKFEQALKFIEKIILEGKNILFIGTKIQSKDLVKETAEKCDLPYINQRWLGGTFTNFNTIKKRINYFKDLEEKRKKGELDKHTKLERLKIDRELNNLEIKFGGIKEITGLPYAIFVVDMKKDALAVKEAKSKGVKVIGITDTNIDPTIADYAIPANDDSISSIKYVLDKVKEVILKAKSK